MNLDAVIREQVSRIYLNIMIWIIIISKSKLTSWSNIDSNYRLGLEASARCFPANETDNDVCLRARNLTLLTHVVMIEMIKVNMLLGRGEVLLDPVTKSSAVSWSVQPVSLQSNCSRLPPYPPCLLISYVGTWSEHYYAGNTGLMLLGPVEPAGRRRTVSLAAIMISENGSWLQK